MPVRYYVNGDKVDVADEKLEAFLQQYPDAIMGVPFSLENKKLFVPTNKIEPFKAKYPDAVPIAPTSPPTTISKEKPLPSEKIKDDYSPDRMVQQDGNWIDTQKGIVVTDEQYNNWNMARRLKEDNVFQDIKREETIAESTFSSVPPPPPTLPPKKKRRKGYFDIYTDQLRKELEDKPLASVFITGLFGERADIGQELPEAKTIPEKIARGAAGLAGIVISFAPISKAMKYIGVGARIARKHRLIGRLIGSAETFVAHGQIMKKGTNYTERLQQAGQDLATGLVFGLAGGLGKDYLKGLKGQVASYPAMFGIGFGMSKMGDSSNEDAIINGALLVALHGLFDIGGRKKAKKFLVDKLKEQGIDKPESVAEEAFKQAEEFKRMNQKDYEELFGKPEVKVEEPIKEPKPIEEKPGEIKGIIKAEPIQAEPTAVAKAEEKIEPTKPIEPVVEKPPKIAEKPKEAPIVPKEKKITTKFKLVPKKPIIESNLEGTKKEYTKKVHFADRSFEKPKKPIERIKMALTPETAEKINKTEIMTGVEKTFGVPLKSKATHRWKNAGAYYPKEQIIRMEKWGELSTLSHEVAHHVDNILKKSVGKTWLSQNSEIVKELKSLDYDQKKKRIEEGFAEYLRYRMTTDLAKEKAPKFHEYFNKEILDNNPSIKSKIDGLKKKMDVWFKQGAENRIIQHIDWEGEHTKIKGIKPKLKKALGVINRKFNDEFYVPQKIVREIEKTIGRKLPPTKNPAIMMEYSKSKAGAIARTFVIDKAINEYGKVVGPGLVEVLKPIKNKEMKQFISYAVSLRAVNLEKRNIQSGFDVEDAKFVIAKHKNKGWDKTAQDLTEWAGHSLDWVVRAGGLDSKTAQLFRDLNPIYLTFKRAFLDEVGVVKGAGGYVDTGGVIKGIKGSGRPIVNPIESMIAQNRELIAKAQKIKIASLFADLAKEEGVGGFIVEVPVPIKAVSFDAKQMAKYIKEAGGDLKNLDDFLTVFTQDFRFNGKENIVSIWKNGKRKFYEIHPELYKSFKGVDPLKLGPVLKVLAPFARALRLGATGIKVSFGLARNPFRDAFSYVVFSKRNNVTIFDPIKGTYKSIKLKEGELTWKFKKLGGALAGQIGLDRAATQNTYDEMLSEKLGKKGKVLKVVKHPVNALRDILSITEMGPRSVEIEGAYKKYTSEKWRKKHPDWTDEDAFVQSFVDAQDVTINFTKSGEWARQINQATAFFNVAIRGPEKVYRSFRERPIQTLVKGITWLTLLSIGSWYKNKDKDWYKNLPPAYKYNNLFFEIGDNIFRLPIPFELGIVFMSVPQAALDTYKDQDLKWIMSLKDLAKAQIPDPTPTVFQPVIDIKTNKNYLGVPIESPGMQYLYPTERKKSYTTKFAVETSKGLDKIGVHLSPIQLDYLLDSYSGGFSRQFRISGKELHDYPVIGDLMLRDPYYPRRQLNEYYADFETLGQKKASGIATRTEIVKFNRMKSFNKYYTSTQKRLKRLAEQKNKEELKKYYKHLTKRLKSIGYD